MHEVVWKDQLWLSILPKSEQQSDCCDDMQCIATITNNLKSKMQWQCKYNSILTNSKWNLDRYAK